MMILLYCLLVLMIIPFLFLWVVNKWAVQLLPIYLRLPNNYTIGIWNCGEGWKDLRITLRETDTGLWLATIKRGDYEDGKRFAGRLIPVRYLLILEDAYKWKPLVKVNKIIFWWYYKRVPEHFRQWTFIKSVRILISNYIHLHKDHNITKDYNKVLSIENEILKERLYQADFDTVGNIIDNFPRNDN